MGSDHCRSSGKVSSLKNREETHSAIEPPRWKTDKFAPDRQLLATSIVEARSWETFAKTVTSLSARKFTSTILRRNLLKLLSGAMDKTRAACGVRLPMIPWA